MRLLLFIGLVLGTVTASAQSRVEVYPDDRMLWREMMLHAENGVVREGSDWRGQVLWTTQPEKFLLAIQPVPLTLPIRYGKANSFRAIPTSATPFCTLRKCAETSSRYSSGTARSRWTWFIPFGPIRLMKTHSDCTKRIASAHSTAFVCSAGCLLRRSFTRCSWRKGCCSA